MATVMSLALAPPVVYPLAAPPPMATVRFEPLPPATWTPPEALHPLPMATLKEFVAVPSMLWIVVQGPGVTLRVPPPAVPMTWVLPLWLTLPGAGALAWGAGAGAAVVGVVAAAGAAGVGVVAGAVVVVVGGGAVVVVEPWPAAA